MTCDDTVWMNITSVVVATRLVALLGSKSLGPMVVHIYVYIEMVLLLGSMHATNMPA